jgi:hypothetical protein
VTDRSAARLAGRHLTDAHVAEFDHVMTEEDASALRTVLDWVAATTGPGSLHVPQETEETNTVPSIPLRGPALWYVTTGRFGQVPIAFEVSVPYPPGAPLLTRPERDLLMALLRYTVDVRELDEASAEREQRREVFGRD